MASISSALASQLFDRQLIVACLQQRGLVWYDYQAELRVEVWAWSVWVHKPREFSVFLSFFEVLDAFVLRLCHKAERVQVTQKLPNVFWCSGIQDAGYTVQVRTHKIVCNCKLFKCLDNRIKEFPDLARKLEDHDWFSGQGTCHHIMAVLPEIGYSNLADYLEF